MYFPKSKILENQYTAGKEYTLANKDYIGYYTLLANEQAYTGKTITNNSQLLVKGSFLNSNKVTIYDKLIQNNENINKVKDQIALQNYLPKPSEEDYKIGSIQRYFAKISNSTKIEIIEIDKKSYESVQNKDNRYFNIYEVISLQWKISGPLFDKPDNHIYGIINTNERVLVQANQKMDGLLLFLKDLNQFGRPNYLL